MNFEDAINELLNHLPEDFSISFEDAETSITLKRDDGFWQVATVKHDVKFARFMKLENAIAYLKAKIDAASHKGI